MEIAGVRSDEEEGAYRIGKSTILISHAAGPSTDFVNFSWGRVMHSRLRLVALLVIFVWPAAASAAVFRSGICTDRFVAAAVSSDTRLVDAAKSAEAKMADRADKIAAADDALDLLSKAADESAVSGDSLALAKFCSAAGEALRLSKSGSPLQARNFLISAVGYAEDAQNYTLEAKAAYRLGLNTITDTAISARGERGVSGAEKDNPYFSQPETKGRACQDLIDAETFNPDSKALVEHAFQLTEFAFGCAVRQSRDHDFDVLARATLHWARLLLDRSNYPSDPRVAKAEADAGAEAEATEPRGRAAQIALVGLKAAVGIARSDVRTALIERLSATAVEAGQSKDHALTEAITRLREPEDATSDSLIVADMIDARIKLAGPDPGSAAGPLREAIYRESQANAPVRLPELFVLLAKAEPGEERKPNAHLAEGYRALNAARPVIGVNGAFDPITEESIFATRERPVFDAYVDDLLKHTPETSAPLQFGEVQSAIEAYRQAELQDAFGSECVPPRSDFQAPTLYDGEVLLYPILLGDRIELLYAVGSGTPGDPKPLHFDRVVEKDKKDNNRASVLSLVDKMVNGTRRAGFADWKGPAESLYKILIAPIAQFLQNKRTLVIVPDGQLSALPFAALQASKDHPLIMDYAIAVIPSLDYAQLGKDRPHDNPFVVAATLTEKVELPTGTFKALNSAEVEGRFAIGENSRRNIPLPNFTVDELKAVLNAVRPDIVHLSTHASFNGRSYRAFVVAKGGMITISELRDMIGRGQTRGEQLDLLVLSACETAVGDDAASMGLAGVAVQAGARSVLASLWEASDLATKELMKTFYTKYRKGSSKAEALRAAQLELIKSGSGFGHPYFWAAFTLLGSWR